MLMFTIENEPLRGKPRSIKGEDTALRGEWGIWNKRRIKPIRFIKFLKIIPGSAKGEL